jgi:hypothetical protein
MVEKKPDDFPKTEPVKLTDADQNQQDARKAAMGLFRTNVFVCRVPDLLEREPVKSEEMFKSPLDSLIPEPADPNY